MKYEMAEIEPEVRIVGIDRANTRGITTAASSDMKSAIDD